MDIHEARKDIDIVFQQLEFTIKLLSFCDLGKIDAQDFDTDHFVMLEHGSLHFPSKHFGDTASIINAARICVLITFSASVLVLDKGFEVMGMDPDPEATDNLHRLRTVIYMVRNAQAHGIAEPRWHVHKRYRRTMTVDLAGASISLDLKTLHGQLFDIDQLGGYGNWYLIRKAVDHAFSQWKPT